MNSKTLRCVFLIVVLLGSSRSFPANWLYTVRPGDTLWDLCLKYTDKPGCWFKLDKVNNVEYPRRLPPGFVVSFPVDWLKAVPAPVEVTFVSGDVKVQLQQGADFQVASVGEKLPIGARIVTAEGDINLRFADGSTLQLEPGSELILDTLSAVGGVGIVDSRLRLNQGAVKTRVIKRQPASRFQITTPTAVAAVRGTQYRVSSIPGEQTQMRGEVFEGLVEVSANKTQQPVAAGFGIVARQGEPLAAARPLLPAPAFTTDEAPQSLPSVISWQQLDDAVAYQLEVLSDNDNDELLQRFRVSSLEYSIDTLAIGCYRLRLRGIDQEELQGLASRQTLCITDELAVPTLDKNNIDDKGRFASTLSWLATEGAAHYRVQIAKDASFNTILEEREVSGPQIEVGGKEALFVRVQAVADAGQTSDFSNVLAWQPGVSYWQPIIVYGLIILAIL